MHEPKDFLESHSNKSLKTILVGLGEMGANWFDVLLDEPRVEVVAIVEIRKEIALKILKEKGLSNIPTFTDLENCLKKIPSDVVVDVTTPNARKEIVLKSLSLGRNVMSEKPMAMDNGDLKDIVAEARKSGKFFSVSQNYRWHPALRKIKSIVGENLIGNLTDLNVQFFLGAHFQGFRLEMDHPLVLDMAIHHFDIARFISGSNAKSVYCHEFNPEGSWFKNNAAAKAVFEMEGKINFSYEGNWAAEGFKTDWNGNWRIFGTKGSILWDGEQDIVIETPVSSTNQLIQETIKTFIKVPQLRQDKLAISLDNFINSLNSNINSETWYGDNFYTMVMVLGAVESSDKNKQINLTNSTWQYPNKPLIGSGTFLIKKFS